MEVNKSFSPRTSLVNQETIPFGLNIFAIV